MASQFPLTLLSGSRLQTSHELSSHIETALTENKEDRCDIKAFMVPNRYWKVLVLISGDV